MAFLFLEINKRRLEVTILIIASNDNEKWKYFNFKKKCKTMFFLFIGRVFVFFTSFCHCIKEKSEYAINDYTSHVFELLFIYLTFVSFN